MGITRWRSLREFARKEIAALTRFQQSDRSWLFPLVAAAACGMPMAIGALLAQPRLGALGAVAGLSFLYMPPPGFAARHGQYPGRRACDDRQLCNRPGRQHSPGGRAFPDRMRRRRGYALLPSQSVRSARPNLHGDSRLYRGLLTDSPSGRCILARPLCHRLHLVLCDFNRLRRLCNSTSPGSLAVSQTASHRGTGTELAPNGPVRWLFGRARCNPRFPETLLGGCNMRSSDAGHHTQSLAEP